jgi:hypothetical protein
VNKTLWIKMHDETVKFIFCLRNGLHCVIGKWDIHRTGKYVKQIVDHSVACIKLPEACAGPKRGYAFNWNGQLQDVFL